MKKRVLALLLGCVLLLGCALLLSACQSGGDENSYEEPEEGVLIYAALNPVSKELERSITRFNDAHTDVQIEVRDYSDEGGIQRLLVELAAGHVPDIMELHKIAYIKTRYGDIYERLWFGSKLDADYSTHSIWTAYIGEDYWMPYRRLAQMGYLEDLWPYIENDPDFGRERIIEAPLKAAEVDGGLYMLFREFSVNTLMAPEHVVGERYGWTLDELLEAFSSMPEESTLLRLNSTTSDIFFNLLSPTLEQYVDWETYQCSFDSQGFRDMLLFLNHFPAQFETTLSSEQLEEEIALRALNGRQMLEPFGVGLLYAVPYQDAFFGGRAAFVGYPTGDGSSGNSFILHGNKLAISSTCQNKDAAWEIVRQLIRRSGYGMESLREAHWMQRTRIPVNRKDYELANRVDLSEDPDWMPTLVTGGLEVKVDPPDQDDLRRFEALINSTTQIYWPDNDLTNIVWESIGPYLAGDKSLDDTVALVQNRASLYVSEQQ